jgi:hypothetical protein
MPTYTERSLLDDECGRPPRNFIFGGEKAVKGDFPYIVAIVYVYGSRVGEKEREREGPIDIIRNRWWAVPVYCTLAGIYYMFYPSPTVVPQYYNHNIPFANLWSI